jgi:hypothetical protein
MAYGCWETRHQKNSPNCNEGRLKIPRYSELYLAMMRFILHCTARCVCPASTAELSLYLVPTDFRFWYLTDTGSR